MKKIGIIMMLAFTFIVTAGAQRFALIDMEYITKQIPAFEQAQKQIKTQGEQFQKEIDQQSQVARTLYENYQKEAATITMADRSQREHKIVAAEKKAAELRTKYFGPEGEMAQLEKKLILPLQDRIYEAVKQLSKEFDLDCVFDRAAIGHGMIFASPRIDISNEVLRKLGYLK